MKNNYDKQKTFNDTYFENEAVDVILIQPPLNQGIPYQYMDPVQKAYYAVNGAMSEQSFADLPVEPNWGLLAIAKSLKERGYTVRYIDLNLFDYVKHAKTGRRITSDDITDILQTKQAIIYGISSMTSSFNNSLRLAGLIKGVRPHSYVLMGGIHPSLYAEEILREYSNVDFILKGEGEISFPNLLDYIIADKTPADMAEISGLCYRQENDILVNPPRLLNLEREDTTLDFDLWPADVPFIPRINLSRGCIGKCTYCSANNFFGSHYRLRTKENIITDIQNCIQNKYSKIMFGDLAFGCHREIAEEICRYLIENNFEMSWWCQMRLADCESGLLKLMAQAGCKVIALGFESAETEILDIVDAGKISKRNTYEVCAEINNLGIALQGYFIMGLPNETRASALRTIDYMESLLSYNMTYTHISVCTPFPGTDLYKNPDNYGIKIVDFNFDNYVMNADPNANALPVFNGSGLTRFEVYSLWQLALATAEKYLSKRASDGTLDDVYANIYCERFDNRYELNADDELIFEKLAV